MWRKTRSDYGNGCIGVDANRNFDARWSGPGASSDPCSDTYYGPVVESEQLTKGLSNFIKSNQGRIEVFNVQNCYFICVRVGLLREFTYRCFIYYTSFVLDLESISSITNCATFLIF